MIEQSLLNPSVLELIMWALMTHFVFDWGLQNRWMAENKSKYWEVLLAHSFIYAFGISMLLQLTGLFVLWKSMFILVTHFYTDSWSSKKSALSDDMKHKRRYLHLDHLLHFIQLFVVLFN